MRPEVRSLDFNKDLSTFLVGTRGAEVLEVNAQGKHLKTHVRGHFAGSKKAELWGAACHPKEQVFATCGADRCIRVWTVDNQVMASAEFPDEVYSIDWSPCGNFLVVGDARGQVHSILLKNLKVLSTVKHKSKARGQGPWVQDLKVSPDGRFVAFGVHGGNSNVELVAIEAKSFKLQH